MPHNQKFSTEVCFILKCSCLCVTVSQILISLLFELTSTYCESLGIHWHVGWQLYMMCLNASLSCQPVPTGQHCSPNANSICHRFNSSGISIFLKTFKIRKKLYRSLLAVRGHGLPVAQLQLACMLLFHLEMQPRIGTRLMCHVSQASVKQWDILICEKTTTKYSMSVNGNMP